MPTEPRSSRLEPMPTSAWYIDTIFTRLAAYTCACARAHSQPYARARANGSGRDCESLRPPRAARGLRSTGLLNAYEDLDTRLRVLYRPRDRSPCGIFPFTFASWIFFFLSFFFLTSRITEIKFGKETSGLFVEKHPGRGKRRLRILSGYRNTYG